MRFTKKEVRLLTTLAEQFQTDEPYWNGTELSFPIRANHPIFAHTSEFWPKGTKKSQIFKFMAKLILIGIVEADMDCLIINKKGWWFIDEIEQANGPFDYYDEVRAALKKYGDSLSRELNEATAGEAETDF